MPGSASTSPHCALLGGSKTTVTCRPPQLGHIRRHSSREIGKFGPRVATSVSRSSCLRYTQRLIDRVPSRKPLHRICTRQPRLRAIPNVSTSMRTNTEHLIKSPGGALWAEGHKPKGRQRLAERLRGWLFAASWRRVDQCSPRADTKLQLRPLYAGISRRVSLSARERAFLFRRCCQQAPNPNHNLAVRQGPH